MKHLGRGDLWTIERLMTIGGSQQLHETPRSISIEVALKPVVDVEEQPALLVHLLPFVVVF
jgi:hypothetical protein